MRNYRKYTTYERERKVFAFVMAIILIGLVIIGILTVCGVFDKMIWEPVKSYPIANANVQWAGAGYNGYWRR